MEVILIVGLLFALIGGLVWGLVSISRESGASSAEKDQLDADNKRLRARASGRPAQSMEEFRSRVRERRARRESRRR